MLLNEIRFYNDTLWELLRKLFIVIWNNRSKDILWNWELSWTRLAKSR